jgi:outer membrane protein assembly factor BamB
VTAAPASPAIDPAEARLVWMVDRAGGFGVWTTDLAGGDVRAYAAGLGEAGTSIRDARLVGDDVALVRDLPGSSGAELWLVSLTAPPRLLLTAVESFVVRDDGELLAVRDQGASRSIWRVPTGGGPDGPVAIADIAVPGDGPELGPFGFAISPDGRTVAAGWIGGPVEVTGPVSRTVRDVGAPLVVADDGQLVATTGRAGEAYVLDGDQLVELAPADSDPVAMPGTGSVAWAAVGDDGRLVAVEVRDLLAGTGETHPADGLATNVAELTPDHVILQATAFDPIRRTVAFLDRRDGRFATFEPSAPPGG